MFMACVFGEVMSIYLYVCVCVCVHMCLCLFIINEKYLNRNTEKNVALGKKLKKRNLYKEAFQYKKTELT